VWRGAADHSFLQRGRASKAGPLGADQMCTAHAMLHTEGLGATGHVASLFRVHQWTVRSPGTLIPAGCSGRKHSTGTWGNREEPELTVDGKAAGRRA
jgi:hypothetical protein